MAASSKKRVEDWSTLDQITWVDEWGTARSGWVVGVLSAQLLVRQDLSSADGERFVFKNDPSLRRVTSHE